MCNVNIKKDRTKHIVCAILGICLSLILTTLIAVNRMEAVEAKVSDTQEKLAQEVFRFHVLANSDRENDQELKLKVRDAVIAFMKESMKEEYPGAITAKDTKEWSNNHLEEVEKTAERIIEEEGYSYEARAEVTACYFPDKSYGDVTFPEGTYEALRIEIGAAKGHNWWCVLYPNLCFIDATNAKVTDEGKEDLQEVLTDEEYEMVTSTSEFKIKWFFFGDEKESP